MVSGTSWEGRPDAFFLLVHTVCVCVCLPSEILKVILLSPGHVTCHVTRHVTRHVTYDDDDWYCVSCTYVSP